MAAAPRPTPRDELVDLYERHRAHLVRRCARRLRSRADAEDAVQQVFVYVFTSLERGVRPRHERAWLATIADNVCRNMSRRGAAAYELPSGVPDAATADARPEADARDFAAALAELPPRQRDALVLREWRGLAYREIADVLDMTEPAVETLLFRARRRAAEVLAQRRRVLDLGSVLSAARSLLAPAAAKVGAAAAIGCVGAAVALPLATEHHADAPATGPRGSRAGHGPARGVPGPNAPGVEARPAARPDRPATTPRTRSGRATPGRRPIGSDGAPVGADPAPPDRPATPARSPGTAAGGNASGPAPATTTPATGVVDPVTTTASGAIDTVTTTASGAVGTVTTAGFDAVATATTAAGDAAGAAGDAAGALAGTATGAAGAAGDAVAGATTTIGLAPPPLPGG